MTKANTIKNNGWHPSASLNAFHQVLQALCVDHAVTFLKNMTPMYPMKTVEDSNRSLYALILVVAGLIGSKS